ncbi:MAG TPA: phosphatase domain-containing protein [Longimicrobiales bacterium]|nr:phosphatase domain-containing protein [Longimicrobiales bacterium]
MSAWGRLLGSAVRNLEHRFDEMRGRPQRRARQIVAYRGFGTSHELHVTGRVLANERLAPPSAADSWWRNLRATYRRMGSAEVPAARVIVEVNGGTADAVTDDEGYFRARVVPGVPLREGRLWHDGTVRLADDAGIQEPVYVLTPPSEARFGIISDLDDTVMRTDVANVVRMMRELLLGNAHTRLPFPGVASFYRALHRGAGAAALNPIFYVSSSPWNLYDLIVDFLEHRDIPVGPLMLRDWGVSEQEILPRGHGLHKRGAIRQILDTYAGLPFILIGDSGQEDPEIYREVVRDYPRRILAIYIRNVTPDPLRADAITRLADEVRDDGSTLMLSDDTLNAAQHAARHGWIDHSELVEVRAESKAETRPSDPKSPTVVVEENPPG